MLHFLSCSNALLQGAVDGFFQDPDIHTLYLQVHVSPHAPIQHDSRISPSATLREFRGWNTAPDAPAWTQWATGTMVPVWQERGHIADLFVTLALWRENLTQPGLSAQMVEWALAITVSPLLVHIRPAI